MKFPGDFETGGFDHNAPSGRAVRSAVAAKGIIDDIRYYDIVIAMLRQINDAKFTRAFERGDIPNQDFHHASHLRVAWVYLRESASLDQAIDKMCATIQRFAASAGHAEKYHQTITVFWMRVLAALAPFHRTVDLEIVLQENPPLLKKDFILEYFSRETLFSDHARLGWAEPDLKPLPNASSIRSSSTTSDSSHRLVCR